MQLIRPPISTVELTESIYSKLYKVFFSQDSFTHYQFASDELVSDWSEYREVNFWPTKGFEAIENAIDSVWAVVFDTESLSSRPAPRNQLINIKDVIDLSVDDNNNLHYVIFQYAGKVLAYDSKSIRVYPVLDKGMGRKAQKKQFDQMTAVNIGEVEIEFNHGLNYTPARMMWTEKLESDNFINKEAPITKELSDLDWLLLHKAAKKYMDLSNAYPITVAYESDDDSEDPDRTDDKDRSPGAKKTDGYRFMGPGTHIEVPAPADKQDSDLMENPVQLISPEVDTLTWHVTEEKRLENKIFRSVVGTDVEVRDDQAKNEKQIDASFESQLSVLLRIKRNFEIIHKFADTTICRLRYGDSFVGCTIDYGTQFFIKTVTQLHEDYKLAKETGANDIVLTKITDGILDAKFRDDKSSRQRAEVIRDLDPLPEKTTEEAIMIHEKGGIDKINFIIKTNLLNFVRRFERENIPITEFGSNIDYDTKIRTILNKFISYASEQRQLDSDQGE